MRIIAIAGGTSVGKTLFSQYLAQGLKDATLLPLDNFLFNKPKKIPIEQHNFEIPSAYDFREFQKVLDDLKAGLSTQVPLFDRIKGKATSHFRVAPHKYLIIEGNYSLLHASIRSSINYSFFLDSPLDVILSRLILQNLQTHGYPADYTIQQYFAYIRPAYLTHVSPTRQFADLVVNNEYTSRLDVFVNDFLSKYQL